MAQKIELKDERPLQTFWLKNFKAVNTVASRIAEPDDSCFYDLTNAQPIGQANLHSVADATFIYNFGATRIYKDWAFNLDNPHSIIPTNNQEVIFAAGTDGSMHAYYVGQTEDPTIYPPNTPVVIQIAPPGYFSGTDSLDLAQYDNGNILFIDSKGYFFWNGNVGWSPGGTRETGVTPISTPTMSPPNANGAPTQGSSIAVYNDMVWIAQGRTIYWSVPGTASTSPGGSLAGFEDFTSANGGGWDTITDSTLRSDIKALFAANGYLYVFGETSIDVISGVQTTTVGTASSTGIPITPAAVTTFQRLNISASVGTDFGESIISYGSYVFFANRYGAWQIIGSSVMSLSSDVTNNYLSGIDGTWQYLDFLHYNDAVQWINRENAMVDWVNSSGNTVQWQLDNYTPYLFKPAAACVESNKLLCAAFLVVRKNDPIMGSGNFLCMYQGYPNDTTGQNYKWWFADWTSDIGPITHITQSFVNFAPALFGYITDPVSGDCKLYQFFADDTSAPSARMMTALWDFKDLLSDKQALRAGIRVSIHGCVNPAMNVYLDTLNNSYQMPLADIGITDWVNLTDQPVQWQNSTPVIAKWNNLRNFMIYWGKPEQAFSKCLGFTVKSIRGTKFEMNSFMLDYKIGSRWVGD